MSKRADAPYRSGRGEHWHKVKCWQRGRFVVVGFAPDGMGGLAKLRLARREGGKLVYVGRVGTGWDYKTARKIRSALAPLARDTSPLSKPIRKLDTTWVEPRYEAEITYADTPIDPLEFDMPLGLHPNDENTICPDLGADSISMSHFKELREQHLKELREQRPNAYTWRNVTVDRKSFISWLTDECQSGVAKFDESVAVNVVASILQQNKNCRLVDALNECRKHCQVRFSFAHLAEGP